MQSDKCAKCGKPILYLAGAQAWLHGDNYRGLSEESHDHLGEPKTLTDLKNHPTSYERFKRAKERRKNRD
ncbi:hypothetical protein SEQ_HALENA_119 [Mycobacterium phage Halena]|uniref:Uncharacterized protein n=1 Tax=Mycobacterium phage Halena TaxID=2517952 RepID=A0A482JEC2_9CAUD|nr:hypothetical protein SEQ_HALENA_119 [Mycobacterium phage Halena]